MHTLVVIVKGHPQAITLFFKTNDAATKALKDVAGERWIMADDYGNAFTVKGEDISAVLMTDVEKKHDADLEMTVIGFLAQDKMNARAASDPRIVAAQKMQGVRQSLNGAQVQGGRLV